MLLVALVLGSMSPLSPARAAEPAPVKSIALGESNDDAQRAELLAVFGAGAADPVTTVTVDETLRAWEGVFDLTGVDSAYSSTALTCRAAGSGVDVTTRNIEVVPPTLYALALVTAGIGDADLIVAAPADDPALGMTALTGVFKTWDAAPCAAVADPAGRRRFALEELALVAQIGGAHGGPAGVGLTTDAMLEIQREIVTGGAGSAGGNDVAGVVSDRAAKIGLELTADEQSGFVDYFSRLAAARFDWGGFGQGWSVDRAADGSRVALKADPAKKAPPTAAQTSPGVGGPSGPIVEAPSATVAPSPTASPTPTPAATATALAESVGSTETLSGIVSKAGPDGLNVAVDGELTGSALFSLAPGAAVRRDGRTAGVSDLRPGDRVELFLKAGHGRQVTAVDARHGAAAPAGGRSRGFLKWWLVALAAGLLLLGLFGRRRRRPGLLFARVSPEVAAAAVARRRASESAAAVGGTVNMAVAAARSRAFARFRPRLRTSGSGTVSASSPESSVRVPRRPLAE